MPVRETPLVTDEYYHVYNRGLEKRDVFLKTRHYYRFLETLNYYQFDFKKISLSRYLKKDPRDRANLNYSQNKTVVDVISYCLMPNHFHLLLKQNVDNGLSNYLRLVTNSYTKYYNQVCHRNGPLFSGRFKAKLIENNYSLLHISRYIHLNPVVSYLIPAAELCSYPYSSMGVFSGNPPSIIVKTNTSLVSNQFKSPNDYVNFCQDQIDYGISLELIKHQVIDVE